MCPPPPSPSTQPHRDASNTYIRSCSSWLKTSSHSHALQAAPGPPALTLLTIQLHGPCLLPAPTLTCCQLPHAPCFPTSPARPGCSPDLGASLLVPTQPSDPQKDDLFLKPFRTSPSHHPVPTMHCGLVSCHCYLPRAGMTSFISEPSTVMAWSRVGAQEMFVK